MPRNANQSKQASYSLDFLGGSSYITVPTSDSFAFGTGGFTINTWVNFPTDSGQEIILEFRSGGYKLWKQPDETILWVKGSLVVQTTTSLSLNTWHLVTVLNTGSSTSIYIDGKLDSSVVSDTASYSASNLYIGKFEYGGYAYRGKMSDVSIFDYALSASQVTTLYGDSTNGPGNPMALPSSPIAYYPLGTSAWNGQYLAENNAIGDYVFDFSGLQNIDCTNNSSLTPTSAISISLWVKTSDTGNFVGLVDKWNGTSSTGYMIDLGPSGSNQGKARFSISNQNSVVTTVAINDGAWHHIVATCDNTDGFIYLDGVQNNTGSLTMTGITNSDNLKIASDNSSTLGFNGEMSNVQLFNTALSGPEVETLYNYGSPIQTLANIPQSSNLKAWYKLDASDIYDSSITEWNNIEARANNKGSMLCGYNSWSGQALIQSYNSPVERSISIWVRRTASMGYHGVCTQPGVGGAQAYSQFFVWSNRGYTMSFYVPSPNKWVDFGYMAPDTWYHAVLTDTGVTAAGRFKTYWNGKFANSSTNLTYDLGTFTNGFKWAGGSGVGLWSGGSIADGRLFDTVLSASEVETLYNNGAPSILNNVKPNNLKQWLTFENIDTSVGGGLYDKSGNNNQLTTPLYPWVAARAARNLNVPISALNGLSTGMSQSNLVQSDLQTVAPYSKYAIEFDHTDADYITLTNNINLGSTFSFSVWLKTDHVNSPGDSQNTYVKNITGGTGFFNFFSLFMMGLNVPKIGNYVANTSGSTGFNLSTNNLNDNIWHHCFLTFDGSTLRSYVDGSLNVTIEGITSWTSNILKKIGKYEHAANLRCFDGILSNMAVWNSALTASKAREVYNEGIPSNLHNFSGTAPVAWWQLGENSSFTSDWVFADGIGSNNGQGQNLTEINLTNGVGTTANGVSTGMSESSLIGDAPYSTANAISNGMPVTARGTDVPS